MRSWGLILVLIAITAGIFISSMKSVSLLKGSHVVYNISSNSVDVNCSSCHNKHVAEEMAITRALHGPHWDLSCVTCHRFKGTGISFATANSSGVFPGKQAHAAYIPSCLDCHGGKGAWVYNVSGVLVHAPPARAFNVTETIDYRNWTVISSIPYYAAHKQFIAYCEKVLHDENLACLACHTNFSINITYRYPDYVYVDISGWNITTSTYVSSTQKVYNVSYVKKPIFSGKHVFLPLRDINCSKCHENIYLGLINGKHAPVYISWKWPAYNLWGFYRYHGLAYYGSTVNASWINDSYCDKCHYCVYVNLTVYSTGQKVTYRNPFTAASKGLVHCAEKVSCYTCHHRNSTYWWLDPYYAFLNATQSSPWDAPYHEALINQTAEKYPRYVHGDICMACHMAAYHFGSCKWACHAGNRIVTQYTEP